MQLRGFKTAPKVQGNPVFLDQSISISANKNITQETEFLIKHRLLPPLLGTVVSHTGSRACWVSPPQPSRHVRMFPLLSTQRSICVMFTHCQECAGSTWATVPLSQLLHKNYPGSKCNSSRVLTKASWWDTISFSLRRHKLVYAGI